MIERLLVGASVSAFGVAAMAQTLLSPDYFYETYASGLPSPTTFVFVAPGKMLVCERLTGKVSIRTNGVYSGEALDLPVANSGEQGLLGICLDRDFPSPPYVYIYYSRAVTDGGSWLENRVDRFMWDGGQLVLQTPIFSIPYDASQQNPIYHHGGYLKAGPDGKIYIMGGELVRGRFSNPRIEQNTHPSAVAGAGAIYRVNTDGTIPLDNPFVFHPDPKIKAIWIYGFRNGFGHSFDPLTGRFWFTDNGPNVYDELNLGFAGMNAGWLKIMGPDSRNAVYSDNGNTPFDASDLVFLAGATYSDPKFSWLQPVGITSVEFLHSFKFDGQDRYKILVGDANLGNMYLFSLNSTRDGLIYLPGTEDTVADSSAERDQYRLGNGFGLITDMQIGPDGFLYVCDLYHGRIYRVRPRLEPLAMNSYAVEHGIRTGGSLESLIESDDDKLRIRSVLFPFQITPPIRLGSTAVSPVANTTELRLIIESSADSINVQQTVELYNFETGSYEVVDARAADTSDSTVEVVIVTNPSRFIRAASREVWPRITYRQVGPTFNLPWHVVVDRLILKVLHP